MIFCRKSGKSPCPAKTRRGLLLLDNAKTRNGEDTMICFKDDATRESFNPAFFTPIID